MSNTNNANMIRTTRTFFYLLSFFVLAVGVFVGFVIFAQAQGLEEITYPISELGGCKSEQACKSYCDDSAHLSACLDFAEEHGLLSDEELEQARKFEEAGGEGPGGCTGKDSCEAYCDDITHMDECIAFAEENDFMPEEELEEARKVQAALKGGATLPGGCKNKNECESYCQNPDRPERMEECLTFAEAAGFIPPEELGEAKKVLQAVKRGVKPPPCAGKKQCDDYCNAPENFEACLTFAEAAGLIPPEELEQAKQAIVAIRKGVPPPKCRGQEECDAYCGEDEHLEECMNFAIAAGFMSEEDAEMARKTGGKGPGNCRGKEECEAFCEDPANQETCFSFAKEHGLISEEDLEQMEEGKAQIQEALEGAPDEVLECFKGKLGSEKVEELMAGTAMPSQEIGNVMQECFQSMMSQEGGFGPGGFGPGEFEEGEEGFFDRGGEEGMEGPFRPDPSKFRSQNGATPFFGQDEGVPNPQDPIFREQLKKELESRGLDPSQFEGVFNQEQGFGEEGQGAFDSERFRETLERSDQGSGVQGEVRQQMEQDIRQQMEQGIREQMEGQMRQQVEQQMQSNFQGFQGPPAGSGFPPAGETFSPPPGGEGGGLGGNLFRAVRNVLFVLGAE